MHPVKNKENKSDIKLATRQIISLDYSKSIHYYNAVNRSRVNPGEKMKIAVPINFNSIAKNNEMQIVDFFEMSGYEIIKINLFWPFFKKIKTN